MRFTVGSSAGRREHILGPFATAMAAHKAYVAARKAIPDRRYPDTYRFTEQQRALVVELASRGAPPAVIVRHIYHPLTREPITTNLLKNAFKEELLEGQRTLDLKMSKAVDIHLLGRNAEYLMDDEGKPVLSAGRPVKIGSELYPNANFLSFLMKNKFGYQDRVEIEHSSAPENEISEELKNFSTEEKRQIRDALRRARERAAGGGDAMTAPPMLEGPDASN